MSLQLAANHLASKGRGPDTMLVHMAPSEVAGLHALARAHGGTLTTNPDTGLPEAGFLKSILPTIIGAGLAATGVGAPMAALLVGGGYGLASGNMMKGITAGLGAYGGAGLGAGLMGAGAEAAANSAVAPLASGADAAATQAYADQFMQAKNAALNGSFTDQLGTMGKGLAAAVDNPSAFANNLGGGTKAAQYGLAALAPGMAAAQQQMLPVKNDANPFRYRYETERLQGPYTNSSAEAMQLRGRYVPYAEGGPVEQMSNQAQYDTMMANGGELYAGGGILSRMAEYIKGHPGLADGESAQNGYSYDPQTQQYTAMAAGGMSDLGGYSDGGRLLRGPGDGVSDSIPATIGDNRPARLADGEFVVPARIVSELGNGSTDAGARKLYGMMDRIQKNRAKTVGKNKVAVDSRSDKMLPA